MRRTLTTIALLSAAAFCAHADDNRLMTSVTQADLQEQRHGIQPIRLVNFAKTPPAAAPA